MVLLKYENNLAFSCHYDSLSVFLQLQNRNAIYYIIRYKKMILNVIFIVLGIVTVLWGADRLTEGAVAVAEKLKVPQIVIGLTIVAVGTSMPEFCVSLVSAIKGTPDLAVGNVVGSNIFNTLLIVGVAAVIAPITILPSTVKKDIPFALVASALLMMLGYDGNLSRIDAVVLLIMFAAFMYITLKVPSKLPQGGEPQQAKIEEREVRNDEMEVRTEDGEVRNDDGETSKDAPLPLGGVWRGLLIPLGLTCLIVGSNIFVNGATFVAGYFGVSEAVIGLTVVAMGTSLPELATTVVAARKGNSGIAIGNVLGSNVFNILLILGATGVICPMELQGITMTDFSMMGFSMILLWLFSFTKYEIERWEGAFFIALFVGYMATLL